MPFCMGSRIRYSKRYEPSDYILLWEQSGVITFRQAEKLRAKNVSSEKKLGSIVGEYMITATKNAIRISDRRIGEIALEFLKEEEVITTPEQEAEFLKDVDRLSRYQETRAAQARATPRMGELIAGKKDDEGRYKWVEKRQRGRFIGEIVGRQDLYSNVMMHVSKAKREHSFAGVLVDPIVNWYHSYMDRRYQAAKASEEVADKLHRKRKKKEWYQQDFDDIKKFIKKKIKEYKNGRK